MSAFRLRWPWQCPRCDEKVTITGHAESAGTTHDEDGNVTGVQLKAVIDDDAQPAKDHLREAHGIDVSKGETP